MRGTCAQHDGAVPARSRSRVAQDDPRDCQCAARGKDEHPSSLPPIRSTNSALEQTMQATLHSKEGAPSQAINAVIGRWRARRARKKYRLRGSIRITSHTICLSLRMLNFLTTRGQKR